MQGFIIFVEGLDTEPAKLPVYIVNSEEHASLLCEGMKETEYATFDFSFQHFTRSDRGKLAFWLNMICDARRGVYGNIVGGIHDMIDGAYYIMTGHRFGGTIASGANAETANGDSATQAEQDDETPATQVRKKGVTLRHAAEKIRPNDPDGQKALRDAWRKSRTPKLPNPIGKSITHRQRNLYEPAALLAFLKEIEGERVDQDFGLSGWFRRVSDFPRRQD